jgi:hypothetical protein
MNAKYSDTKISEVFFDTKTTAVVKKIVRPIAEQGEYESRRYVIIEEKENMTMDFCLVYGKM